MEAIDWNQRYVDADTPWDSGIPSEELTRFVDAGLVKPCRALELGCGTGTNAIFLAQRGFQVTAVDISETAINKAKEKAEKAGVSIELIRADVTDFSAAGKPFKFVFDRGTYHVVRNFNIGGLQRTLSTVVEPGGYYLVLAGNANEDAPPDKGPPRVAAHELCKELEFDCFDLVSLEEAHFHGIKIDGEQYSPLAWKAILRRRTQPR
jgi:methyl halide transferase